jgi:hypothetical protein
MKTVTTVFMAIPLLLIATPGYSLDVTRTEAKTLMDQCRELRAENIAPLKEQEIDKCVIEEGKDEASCERFNATFGETSFIGGIARPGLFWDLPTCQDALAAERYFKKYPGKSVYRKQ